MKEESGSLSIRPPFGKLAAKLKDQAEGLVSMIYPSLVSPSQLINLKDSQEQLTRHFMSLILFKPYSRISEAHGVCGSRQVRDATDMGGNSILQSYECTKMGTFIKVVGLF